MPEEKYLLFPRLTNPSANLSTSFANRQILFKKKAIKIPYSIYKIDDAVSEKPVLPSTSKPHANT